VAEGDPEAPVVVLVHGYPDTHRVWDEVAAALVPVRRVVRYDVRGAGGSEAPRGLRAYRLDRLADDVFSVIDSVSPDRPVHLVGHDWGSIQCWEAVTDARAVGRISAYTSISGPCLDHLHRTAGQWRKSWYITAFHVPVIPALVWRFGLAARWPAVLARTEGLPPRDGHPAPTLAPDAVRGMALYRANMLPRLLRPRDRRTDVPIRLVTLLRDRYVGPELSDGIESWAPRVRRYAIDAGHWSALRDHAGEIAAVITAD
jgi:pimeloyl-ACP methyl ester carboxylesterase